MNIHLIRFDRQAFYGTPANGYLTVDRWLSLRRVVDIYGGGESTFLSSVSGVHNNKLEYHGSMVGFYHPEAPTLESVIMDALFHKVWNDPHENSLLVNLIFRQKDLDVITSEKGNGYIAVGYLVQRAIDFSLTLDRAKPKHLFLVANDDGMPHFTGIQELQPASIEWYDGRPIGLLFSSQKKATFRSQ